jgi:hypothetical protein
LNKFLKPKRFFKLAFLILIVSKFIIDSNERDLAKLLKVNVIVYYKLYYIYVMTLDSIARVEINKIKGKIILILRSFLTIFAL